VALQNSMASTAPVMASLASKKIIALAVPVQADADRVRELHLGKAPLHQVPVGVDLDQHPQPTHVLQDLAQVGSQQRLATHDAHGAGAPAVHVAQQFLPLPRIDLRLAVEVLEIDVAVGAAEVAALGHVQVEPHGNPTPGDVGADDLCQGPA